MNILLIKARGTSAEHPSVTPPIGLMYIAAYLKKINPSHRIEIIDLRVKNLPMNKLREAVEGFNPQVVGISAVTMESLNMHEIAAVVKSQLSDCKVVVGGPHPSSFVRQTISDSNIDFIVVGEGELTFAELIKSLENGDDTSSVKGIVFKRNGEISVTPQREYIQDLDSLPFPLWELIDIELYSNYYSMSLRGKRRYMVMFTSRSCPYRCIYCHNMFGKGFRARSPENVIEEIGVLYNKYNISEIEILDDIFNFDLKRVERICDLIVERGYKLNIAFPNGLRADRLEKRTLEKMRDAGTRFISVAVESVSPRIQKMIKKNLNISKVKEIIIYAAELGIFTNGFFMLGFPTESLEEVKETVGFALRSKLHTAHFFIVTPFEGTELYEKYKELVRNSGVDFSNYNYYMSSFKLSELSTKKLQRIQFFSYFRFYFNPKRALRIVYSYTKNTGSASGLIFYMWYILRTGILRIIRSYS